MRIKVESPLELIIFIKNLPSLDWANDAPDFPPWFFFFWIDFVNDKINYKTSG